MTSVQPGIKAFVNMIGFALVAVLLSALVHTGTASAQCGPAGNGNTACGTNALQANTAINDTAMGENALTSNTSGINNTAIGWAALLHNTTGEGNTASGEYALAANTAGIENTADGKAALFENTGSFNTATGFKALFGVAGNSSGSDNTADGYEALYSNTTGFDNTASGLFALNGNTTGSWNTASGWYALAANNDGIENTADGVGALENNSEGNYNTASGVSALLTDTTGSNNIGLGYFAGKNIVRGSNNIDIGGSGTVDESTTVRIGTNGTQRATYIAGISTARVTGNVVEVNSNGQLGIAMSSARYKRDIRNMGGASADLMKLRPVTFRYKNDPSGTLEYGLVAEEVQRVYPTLVTYGADGKLQSVRYLEFTALLLNELQKQAHQLQTKDTQLAAQQREIDALKRKDASIDTLSERLAALEQQARISNPMVLRSLGRN